MTECLMKELQTIVQLILPPLSLPLLSHVKYTVQLEEIKHSSPTCTQHHTLLVN